MEFIVFAVACAYGAIYYGQLEANRRQAKAAETQLSEMHADNILDKRPWMLYSGTDFTTESNNSITVTVYFANFGRTPAEWVEGYTSGTGIALTNISMSKDAFGPKSKPDIIAPGNTVRFQTKLNADAIQFIKSGQPLYIFGAIKYKDIFGNFHGGTFCHRIGSDLKSLQAAIGFNATYDYGTNNPSD